jgi:hypothetical protein
LVKNGACDVFKIINEEFRNAMIKYMNPNGVRIIKNALAWIMRNELVRDWVYEISDCKLHRENMIKLFIRAKIYQLLKHKNQLYKEPKSFSQTRRQLRDQ